MFPNVEIDENVYEYLQATILNYYFVRAGLGLT